MKKTTIWLLLLLFVLPTTFAQRKMENLGRGMYAVRKSSSQVFVSWRLTGPEYAQNATYNLYRSGSLIATNLTVSDYLDNVSTDGTYSVAAVIKGVEQAISPAVSVNPNNYISIPLQSLASTFVQEVYVGDLDGDGEYDFVLDREPLVAGITSKVEAYKRDGTFLWRVDLGPLSLDRDNIEGGAAALSNGMSDGFTVYDMDGDGKAEVLLKTAKGTTFPDGTVVTHTDTIGNFLSVLNGMTGNELGRIQLPTDLASDGPLQSQFNIAYLDGIMPSAVICCKNRVGNGGFNKVIGAYDYRNGTLSQRWKWVRGNQVGSGEVDFHQQRIVDVDGDGKDEIVDGGYTIDDNGTLLYRINGVYHGDRFHVGDFDPYHPGLEGYGIQQLNASGLAWYYYDTKTGKVLHSQYQSATIDYARGDVGDVDPRYPGCEMWTFTDGTYNVSGHKVSTPFPYPNFSIWWDGDLLSERINETIVDKWDYTNPGNYIRLLTAYKVNKSTINSRNVNPLYGDILGDWREELVYEAYDHSCINIITTTDYTSERIYTLPHNPQYRLCLTTRGYYETNHPDFYLGVGMPPPPVPQMLTAKAVWKGNAANNVWDAGSTSNWVVNGGTGTYTDGDDVMFDISGSPDTLVQLSGALSPSSIKVISPINYTFAGSGSLGGSTGILKAGTGALSLNTTCNFTDSILLQQGYVFVNTTLAQSVVKVSWGATIGGNGTITKPVIMSPVSYISPGRKDEAGTLTFDSNLTIPTRATCLLDITNDSTGLIKPSDKIVVNGNLTVTDTLTLSLQKINGTIKPGTYPIISYSGTFTGSLSKIGITGLFGQKCILTNTAGVISIVIEAPRPASTVKWDGTADTWDLQTTPAWDKGLEQVTFVANDSVILDSLGRNNTIINVTGTLPIADMKVDASVNDYYLSGSGILGGTGGLTKAGKGMFSLLTTNSYTGKTVINGGKFEIASIADTGTWSSIGAPKSVDGSYFVLNDAYLKYSGTSDVFSNRGMTLSGISDTIDAVNSGKMFIWKGLISGTGKLVKLGAGTFRLNTSSNTFTGGTVIKEGIVQLADATTCTNGLGSGAVAFEGGTLTFSATTYGFNNDFVVPLGYTGTLNTAARNSFKGKLTGGGTFNIYLTGTIDRDIFFGDWSAFTGTINVTGVTYSTFRVGYTYGYANATINLGTNVSFYNGGTSDGTGNATAETVTIGALSGSAGSTIKSENWIVGAKNVDATFNGLISGNSITKTGIGTWTLTGANTYAGGTIINGGTLMVNNTAKSGTGTGNVTVNSSGTLAGTGFIKGAVTIASGGVLAPGNNGIGKLTDSTSVTMQTGGSLTIEIQKSPASNDQIVCTGTISLNGALNMSMLGGGSYMPGDNFKIFTAPLIRGSFTSIVPATPGTNLQWDTTALRTTGTIKIVGLQSITFNTLTSKTYGDEAFSISATATSGLPVTFSSLSTTVATVSGNTVTIVGAGTAQIKASQGGDATYSQAADVTQSFTIDKALLTVKPADTIRMNGMPNPVFRLIYSGFKGSDNINGLQTKPVATCSADISSNVGSYDIIVSGGSDKNYSFEYKNGNLTVATLTSVTSASANGDIVVFPNPAKEILNIQTQDAEPAIISINELTGKCIITTKASGKLTKIDISHLGQGLYLVKIKIKERYFEYKFIKY